MRVSLKSNAVKKILARRNLSQNNFAQKIGVCSGYMSQIMTGTRNPSPLLRTKIMEAIKMNEDQFDEIFMIKE